MSSERKKLIQQQFDQQDLQQQCKCIKTSKNFQIGKEQLIEIQGITYRKNTSQNETVLKYIRFSIQSDPISQQLQKKINKLELAVNDKTQQQILNIRINLLSLTKILVFTHGKYPFRMVQAHVNLGEAYYNFRSNELAIDHFLKALKKSQKLFNQIKEIKIYSAHIYTQLGKCYESFQNYEDAFEQYSKAFQIYNKAQTQNNEDYNNAYTLTLISNCHLKQKKYDQALQNISRVLQYYQMKYGKKSQKIALTYIQIANIYSQQDNYLQAQQYQIKAIQILVEINYSKPQYVATLYEKLGNFQQKNGDINGEIQSLHKVKTINQLLYSPNHQKVLQVQRKISIILIRYDRIDDALKELKQILQLQKKLYGSYSIPVAKTYKIIGIIYISLYNNELSKFNLQKANKIMLYNGLKKQARQIRKKIILCENINLVKDQKN